MGARIVGVVCLAFAGCQTSSVLPAADADPIEPDDAAPERVEDSGSWPDVPPGVFACVEGHYEGTFEGQVMIAGLAAPSSGEISLTLTRTGSGEFLEVGDGILSGGASDQFGQTYPYVARIEGILNCSLRRLEARILDGVLTWPLLGDYGFEGDLAGDYVIYEHHFVNGTWNTVQTTRVVGSPGTFVGTWTASLTADDALPEE